MELVCGLLIAIVFVLVHYSAATEISDGWVVPDPRCDDIPGGALCVQIEKCTVLYRYISQKELSPDEVKKTINEYICNHKENKVCCPFILPDIRFTNIIANHMEHTNYKLLPKICGKTAPGRRVVGGTVTEIFKFPWAVALKYNTSTNPWQCGASLISERYVLTAAHCIKSDKKLTTVRLGEYNFDEDPDCQERVICAGPPQDFEVSVDDAIIHPDYNVRTHENDIALIRLRKSAEFNLYSVRPICLPITIDEKTIDIMNYTVAGWGRTEKAEFNPILLRVDVPVVTNAECASIYASKTKIVNTHLCAGGKNQRDTCRGDSGSALMADVTLYDDYRTIQYGIVSVGPSECAFEGYPTLYTRVSKYIGWILDNLQP